MGRVLELWSESTPIIGAVGCFVSSFPLTLNQIQRKINVLYLGYYTEPQIAADEIGGT
jgi:hypothetical protein